MAGGAVGPVTRFDFSTATEIVFGRGRIAEVGARTAAFGRRALVVTGADVTRAERVRELLLGAGVHSAVFSVPKEPTTALAVAGVRAATEFAADVIVGIGGGSALDAAKAIAALVANGGDPLDYLEVVGRGQALSRASLAVIAIPTTSGTGSEVTRNAVLQAEAAGVKVSLRSLLMLPRVALVDSELTHSVPPRVTAATGLDALTQVLEPYVSSARGPLTDALCLEGLRRGARSLARAYHDGRDAEARDDLAVTSLFGGLALANAKLGAVHGFAGPLGGAFDAPHGALCARLLPEVMTANLTALRERGDEASLLRYATIAEVLTDTRGVPPEAGIEFVRNLVAELAIPRLAAYGVARGDFAGLISKARAASSMKGNPVELPEAALFGVLERAL